MDRKSAITETASAEFGVEPSRIWSFISDFGGLKRWHPEVVNVTVTPSPRGPQRSVELANGRIVEALDLLDSEALVVAYTIVGGDFPPFIGLRARMWLTATGPKSTRLDWSTVCLDDGPESRQAVARMNAGRTARFAHLEAALAKSA